MYIYIFLKTYKPIYWIPNERRYLRNATAEHLFKRMIMMFGSTTEH